jgi:hypothetical protein
LLVALLSAIGVFSQSATALADKCQLFDNANLTGLSHTMTVPITTSPSPLPDFYASTSARRTGHGMLNTGMHRKASSVLIEAWETDVALYLTRPGTVRNVLDIETEKVNFGGSGDFFDGFGMVLYCPQGMACTYNLQNTGFENNANSFICQREFYRRSHLVLPGSTIRDSYFEKVRQQVAAEPDLEDSPWAQFSTVAWMPGAEWCQRYGHTWCMSNTVQGQIFEPWIDHLRLHSDFMVNPAGGAGDIFLGNYRVVVEHFVHPAVASGAGLTNVLVNHTFWWFVVVEAGTVSGTIGDAMAEAANNTDAGAELTNGIYDQVGKLLCPGCTADQRALTALANLGGLQRVQLAHRVTPAGVWNTRTYNATTPPDIVLNKQRTW